MSPVLELVAGLKNFSDEDLHSLFTDFPSFTDMEGYSCAAKLGLAQQKAALLTELKLRALIP